MPAYRRLKLDEQLWERLLTVHRGVLAVFLWRPDKETFGRREHWDRPKRNAHGYLEGDCDDFAIECDHRLRELGVPLDAMTYYSCRVETGEGHLVLGSHTDAGVYVLDNRRRFPIGANALARAGYHDWARPTPGRPIDEPWQTVEFRAMPA